MEKKEIIEALKKVREGTKRNFVQTIDLTVNLQNIDPKTLKLASSLQLPKGRGKPIKVAAVVDPEAALKAKKAGADLILTKNELTALDKKAIKKAGASHDWFIVQAPMMQSFASAFGAILSRRGKMPYPKDILLPNADPTQLIERMKGSVRIKVKDRPTIQAPVGTEAMSDEDIAENVLAVYNFLAHEMEQGANAIGEVYLKTTMGKAVKV